VQIVYLSARPAVLAGTISSVRAHLSFIDSILIVVPERFRADVADFGTVVIADEELLQGKTHTDHQARNFALRSALTLSNAVADVFLMSDDDSRPLADLDETIFVRDGRYRRYTFGWLDDWVHRSTSFDEGQQATRQVLGLYGFPRHSYASHMPQVIDKELFREVATTLSLPAELHPLCEWSTYFNVAPALHPRRFHDPEPYVTLGWPENLASWQPLVEPGAFLFENHFPEHYFTDAVFRGIDPEDHSLDTAIEKVVRWRHYELEVLAGERAPIMGGPQVSAFRRGLRRVRAVVAGDPVGRDREQRAGRAAILRAMRRS